MVNWPFPIFSVWGVLRLDLHRQLDFSLLLSTGERIATGYITGPASKRISIGALFQDTSLIGEEGSGRMFPIEEEIHTLNGAAETKAATKQREA
eukprot:5647815-Pyramimonas_sp.AAC.2